MPKSRACNILGYLHTHSAEMLEFKSNVSALEKHRKYTYGLFNAPTFNIKCHFIREIHPKNTQPKTLSECASKNTGVVMC